MKGPERNELWIRFKEGDNEALSALYNCYVHQLFSYGLKIHGDEFLVKDCIQEVFIHIIDKRSQLLISGETSFYLFKSLRNKLFEELRSKNRRTDIARTIQLSDSGHEISTEQSIVFSEEEQFRSRTITNAIDKLSDYQKEAIFLKYSHGFDYETIAELLEIDVSSARTLIYRSLKKVKESIKVNSQLILFFFRSVTHNIAVSLR